MAWVPLDKRDSSFYIFHEKFRCRIPLIHMHSLEYIEKFGLRVTLTGNKKQDEIIKHELIETYLSINDMVEYYRKGVNIRVVKVEDTKLIYSYIVSHLLAWKRAMITMLNLDPPIEDLIALDELADLVYPHAKSQDAEATEYSEFIKSINGLLPKARHQLLAPMETTKVVTFGEIVTPVKEPEREKLSPFFTGQMNISRGYKKWD